jgi:hypothetical protein
VRSLPWHERALLAARVAVTVALVAGGAPPVERAVSSETEQARSPALPEGLTLTDGTPSIHALVARLLQALAARDAAAVERLRINRSEYLNIIVPGNVEPGRPPQRIPADTAQFYWEMLDTKSRYSQQDLLNRFGGRTLALKNIRYLNGIKPYAWFVAYGRARLTIEDESGREDEIATGSIAEVRGQFKFVSYTRD